MNKEPGPAHPYIPNSVAGIKREMLDYTGAKDVEEFYADIPEDLRLKRLMHLPAPLRSEAELKRHVGELLDSNKSTDELLSFLGGGCYKHYVPAICDEVNQRAEFLTAYAGEPYDDHGRFQALFEYASMMGDLLEMDVVNVPTYDGYQASATAIRMAARITDRNQILICQPINPGKLSKIMDYGMPDLAIEPVAYQPESGKVDIKQLEERISQRTAAVYFDNPNYFGQIEIDGDRISDLAHDRGALMVTGVDPISLGIIAPPANYGADIVCGDIQTLGMHMQCGGGHAGFIATSDDPRFVMEYPSRLFGIAPTRVPGEYGFGDVAYDRTSFAKREGGKEWVGTAAALWGITAGVYLALMGPQGMLEIGQSIMTRVRYAILRLTKIPNVRVNYPEALYFKEFLVNFDACDRTVEEINHELLSRGIQGGLDLSAEFPEQGQTALYCFTELSTMNDIDRLAQALAEATE
jgi:glycine dehydrogenase subunit 1